VLQVALLHLGAALSPGPDIVLTLRNSVLHGRAAGRATAAGILTGVSLQILACQVGLVWLLSTKTLLFQALAATGGLYLIYLGVSGLRGTPADMPDTLTEEDRVEVDLTVRRFFREGLITNLCNPKALLYFIGIFSLVLTVDIERSTRLSAGLGMIAVQAAAFLAVVHLATLPRARESLVRFQFPLSRIFSLVLIVFGIRILFGIPG